MNKKFLGLFLITIGLTTNAKPLMIAPSFTPLGLAAQFNSIEHLRSLIAQHVDIEEKNRFGQTPLHIAAGKGHADCVKELLQNKANINAKDNQNWTPLHCAARYGHTNFVELFLQNGAEINAKNSNCETPLYLAARGGYIDCVEILLKNGPDVNIIPIINRRRTAKEEAQEGGHKAIVKLIENYENFLEIKEPDVE
ncbi:ankyrin repeat domain-containing protein [bacterium]|nr:MAG: ankyrin repeat domain-containing protein [bacterium]